MSSWKKAYNPDHLPGFIETGIILLIILVIGHTITEDIAVIYHWDHRCMFYLTVAGFVFDLIFTAEFAARSIITLKHGHFKHYITQERGWIDALTSFPLLLLVSGPALVVYLTDAHAEGAFFSFLIILKTAKAIRVTRVLRLIRVIKIFGKIQNTESQMTNRHVATISTIAVVSLVSVLVIAQFVPFLHIGDHEAYRQRRVSELSSLFQAASAFPEGVDRSSGIQKMIRAEGKGDVIKIKRANGEVVFEADPGESHDLMFTAYPDSIVIPGTDAQVNLSFHGADAEHARLNIIVLLCILSIIGSFMLLYTRIFAQQIADPIFVMDKGLREWSYNLEVRTLPGRDKEEVFRLAQVYNNRWLPLKSQIHSYRKTQGGETAEKSVLSLDGLL